MANIVSITSQGQVSIPTKVRQRLGLRKPGKALLDIEGDRIVIEPIDDLLALKGALKHKAKRGIPIQRVIEMEEAAAIQAVVDKYKKKKL